MRTGNAEFQAFSDAPGERDEMIRRLGRALLPRGYLEQREPP